MTGNTIQMAVVTAAGVFDPSSDPARARAVLAQKMRDAYVLSNAETLGELQGRMSNYTTKGEPKTTRRMLLGETAATPHFIAELAKVLEQDGCPAAGAELRRYFSEHKQLVGPLNAAEARQIAAAAGLDLPARLTTHMRRRGGGDGLDPDGAKPNTIDLVRRTPRWPTITHTGHPSRVPVDLVRRAPRPPAPRSPVAPPAETTPPPAKTSAPPLTGARQQHGWPLTTARRRRGLATALALAAVALIAAGTHGLSLTDDSSKGSGTWSAAPPREDVALRDALATGSLSTRLTRQTDVPPARAKQPKPTHRAATGSRSSASGVGSSKADTSKASNGSGTGAAAPPVVPAQPTVPAQPVIPAPDPGLTPQGGGTSSGGGGGGGGGSASQGSGGKRQVGGPAPS